jgi:general secretion pathway protein L
MQNLSDEAIEYEILTTDWFALSPLELVITGSVLLVNSVVFKGALSGDLALNYLKSHPSMPTLVFEDSTLPTALPKTNEHSYVWIAQTLLKSKPLNLCQGSMQHGNATDWIKKGYTLAATLSVIWLLSLLLVNSFSLYSLNKKTAELDEQIELIYRQFFPDAKQVISPKFRISQLLGSNDKTNNQARFWFLLNQFTKGMQGKTATIEQLRFQNKTLLVTIVSPDFASLEILENQLRSNQITVKQTQASTRDKQVVATLEIT